MLVARTGILRLGQLSPHFLQSLLAARSQFFGFSQLLAQIIKRLPVVLNGSFGLGKLRLHGFESFQVCRLRLLSIGQLLAELFDQLLVPSSRFLRFLN